MAARTGRYAAACGKGSGQFGPLPPIGISPMPQRGFPEADGQQLAQHNQQANVIGADGTAFGEAAIGKTVAA